MYRMELPTVGRWKRYAAHLTVSGRFARVRARCGATFVVSVFRAAAGSLSDDVLVVGVSASVSSSADEPRCVAFTTQRRCAGGCFRRDT